MQYEKEKSDFVNINREIDFSFEEEQVTEVDKDNSLEVKTIEDMITSDNVTSVLLDQKKVTENHAVLIDLSNVKRITESSLRTLNYFCSNDGNMEILIKGSVTAKPKGLGKGDSVTLYKFMPQLVDQLFNSEAKLYFKKGEKYVAHTRQDMSIIRLNLR